MIEYQLLHTEFDQISDHKQGIYLSGNLATKWLQQAANNYTINLCLRKLDVYYFLKSMVLEVTVRKNSK